MKNATSSVFEQKRLDSLDILRGFVLFLLVFLQPIIISLASCNNGEWIQMIAYNFRHEPWQGIRFWDMVMPLFLFMTGIAMPFSFNKYKQERDKKKVYQRIVRRVLLLFFLGILVQGNFLAFDPKHIYPLSNTLQAIAIGYLVSAVLLLHFSTKVQVGTVVLLLLLYTIPMVIFGYFEPNNNLANTIDEMVLGRFRDGVYWLDNTWHFNSYYHYTWIWSGLTFIVTVMLGVFANKVMMKFKENQYQTLKYLIITGAFLLLLGWGWSYFVPIIKPIWTSSMALFTGGICFLFLALFYYLIDVKKIKGLHWLKVYGMNSIVAYVVGMVVNFSSISLSLFGGLEKYIGSCYMQTIVTISNGIVLFLLLRLMYKHNKFIRL